MCNCVDEFFLKRKNYGKCNLPLSKTNSPRILLVHVGYQTLKQKRFAMRVVLIIANSVNLPAIDLFDIC